MYEKIIEEIKETPFLKRIFFFETSDPKDFNCMFINEEQKSEFNHIDWLYMAEHTYATLIGIMKNGDIFTIDNEFDQSILCDSFFSIPFVLAELSVSNYKDRKKAFLTDAFYSDDVKDLKKYIEWCEENNFKLRKEDIDWINNG